MAGTFTRINAVIVNGFDVSTDIGRYLDPSLLPGGSNNAAVVPLTGPTASSSQLWRGMPIFLSKTTGMLVPPTAGSGTASTAIPVGILIDDVTAYTVANGTKVTYAKRGMVRTYAAASMSIGTPVKADTTASFSGVLPWVSGTDDPSLKLGTVFPIDDGSASNGSSAAVSINVGDTIFLNLQGLG